MAGDFFQMKLDAPGAATIEALVFEAARSQSDSQVWSYSYSMRFRSAEKLGENSYYRCRDDVRLSDGVLFTPLDPDAEEPYLREFAAGNVPDVDDDLMETWYRDSEMTDCALTLSQDEGKYGNFIDLYIATYVYWNSEPTDLEVCEAYDAAAWGEVNGWLWDFGGRPCSD